MMKWDEYFMSIAVLSATQRSKDPNTKVGACIANPKKRIVGVGYNGMPMGKDEAFTWEREGKDTKYKYVVHAELNAILNSTKDLEGCTLYATLFPCSECAKAIVQEGIKEVIYLSDKYEGTEDNVASKKIFNSCGVLYKKIPFNPIFESLLAINNNIERLEQLKERGWEEVNEEVLFYDSEGKKKIEEMSGKDFNQFESLCDLYAEDLEKLWGTKVHWQLHSSRL